MAQGVWIPNHEARRDAPAGQVRGFDQNFTQDELEWNRGASQQDEKELKELYLDIELFDSRLWLRLGKQNIVWGKTELFRTTDQFNPQDLASPRCRAWRSRGSPSGRRGRSGPSTTSGLSRTFASRWR